MPSSSQQPLPERPKLSVHSACFYTIFPQALMLDALPVEVFDDANPGPTFEEVFPEHIFQNSSEDSETDEEIVEAGQQEYYLAESDHCDCCRGFVYDCDGFECNSAGVCECVGDKTTLQPHYFQVKWSLD